MPQASGDNTPLPSETQLEQSLALAQLRIQAEAMHHMGRRLLALASASDNPHTMIPIAIRYIENVEKARRTVESAGRTFEASTAAPVSQRRGLWLRLWYVFTKT